MAITAFPITTVPATASNVSYVAIAPLTSTNVQNAINQLAGFIPTSANSGTIPVSSLSPPILPNGADQSSNLQVAIDFYTSTGATLQFGVGTYIFNSGFVLKPNIVLRGAGIDTTILKTGVDNTGIIYRWNTPGNDTGTAGIESMTLWGYQDRNNTQGGDKLADIGPFNYYWVRNVKFIYSRLMALAAIGGIGIVDSCVVNQCLRDGINLTGTIHSYVTNNDISQVGDDAIAVSVEALASGVKDYSARITGNRISKSFGIKCLGARNTVIEGNTLRFYTGYAIFVGIDTSFGEGLITKFAISITGNTLLDGLNANNFDAQDIGYGIFLLGDMSLGTGGTAIAQNVGEYNAPGQFVQTPDAFINQAGAAQPRGPDGTISIVSNDIRQTVGPPGMVNFSDAGFGQLWYNTGSVDPAIDSLLGDVVGIGIHADCENLIVTNNNVLGTKLGIEVTHQQNNATISYNNIFRIGPDNGISLIAGASSGKGAISIEHNLIDLDPYSESYLRTVPLDGTWTVSSGSHWMGIWFDGYNGVNITRNRFRNCVRAIQYISGTYINERNILEGGIAGGGGISDFSGMSPASDIFWFCEPDPTDPNYNVHDADFSLDSDSIPTAGVFRQGAFVRNSGPDTDGILGWLRLTSGNAHVEGTDWLVARVGSTFENVTNSAFTDIASFNASNLSVGNRASVNLEVVNGDDGASWILLRNGTGHDAGNAVEFFFFGDANPTFRFDRSGRHTVRGSLSRGAAVTKTANFTVADTENWLINNKSGSTCTVTLPAAASYLGREIMLKTIQAQTVVSASANVVPMIGGSAATAILAATLGKWATLVSNGTNWEIMQGN